VVRAGRQAPPGDLSRTTLVMAPEDTAELTPSAVAAHLEAALARDPSRLDVLARLGALYEFVLRDEPSAQRCHLEHIVRSAGYSDAIEAEVALRTRVAAGHAAPIDSITLGHILAYRGCAEEAKAYLNAGTVLRETSSSHFVFHVVPQSAADAAIDEIITERETGVSRVRDLFDLRADLERRIDCTCYESRTHKAILTGDAMPAHTIVRTGEMHIVWGPLMQVRGVHEDTHVLLGTLGRGSKLLEEGAAMLADRGAAVHLELLERLNGGDRPPISALADNAIFAASDYDLAYPLAGSFVAFLLERAGVAALKRIYPCSWPALAEAAQSTYGASLETLETEWLGALPALAARAAEAYQ
jgi:hypothetical protein